MTARLLPSLWLLFFAASLMPFPVFEAQCVLVAVAGLFLAVSFAVLKHDFAAKISSFDLLVFAPFFGFWAVALLSVLTSQIPYTSLIFFGVFSLLPLSFCCSILARDKGVFFAATGAALAVIFAALSLLSFVQHFTGIIGSDLIRPHWPFADPNTLAGFLLPGFFIGAGLMIAAPGRGLRNAGLALAVLDIAGLLATGSRGGFVALILALLVFAVLGWPQIRQHRRCVFGVVTGTAIAVLLLHFFSAAPAGGMAERVLDTVTGREPLLWERPGIWAGTWKLIEQHFWTGTGLGTFYLYYPEVRGADLYSAGRMAHNDPLQFWAEMGILAPLVFYGFLAVAVLLTLRALKLLPGDDMRRIHIIAPACALGAIVLQAQVNFPFYVPSILTVSGILLGYWFWQVRAVLGPLSGQKGLNLPDAEILKILLIVPLLAAGYGFLILQGSHIVYERGDAKGQIGDLDGFAADINKAGRMAMQKSAPAIVMAARVKLANLEARGGIVGKDSQQIHDEALVLLTQAEELNPRLVTVSHTRARLAEAALLLGLQGKNDAEMQFLAALKLDPTYFPARIDLARFYRIKKNNARAYEILKEGMKWKGAASVPRDYYELLMASADEQGDTDTAVFALKALGQYHPMGGR